MDCRLSKDRHSNKIAVMFMSTQRVRFEYWINPRSEYYFMEFITTNAETIISMILKQRYMSCNLQVGYTLVIRKRISNLVL